MVPNLPIVHSPLAQFFFYVVLALIPYYQLRHQSPGLPLDWYMAIISLFFAGLYFIFTKEIPPRFYNRLNRWLFLFFIVNCIASLLSPYPVQVLSGMTDLLLGYVFIYLNLLFITRKGFVSTLPLVLGWSVCLNALFASIGYFGGVQYFTHAGTTRTYGYTIGANNMALMGCFMLPILLNFVIHGTTGFRKFMALVGMVVGIAGIISSASRAGFLIMIFLSLLLPVQYRKKFHPKDLGVILTCLLLGACVVLVSVPESYFERQQTLVAKSKDSSLRRRAAYIKVALSSFSENPFWGTGTDSFKKIWERSHENRKYDLTARAAHNMYLEVLVGSGSLGIILFMGILYQALRDFTLAKNEFSLRGDEAMASLIGAYRLSLCVILVYLFFKSAQNHKLYFLILSLSQIAYSLAFEDEKFVGTDQ